MNTLLAVGLGYSANAITAKLNGASWRIVGTARNDAGLQAIAAKGYEAVPFDGEAPSHPLRLAIAEATHLLMSAPPDADGDPLLRHHGDDLRRAPKLEWIGYLSTIGVYGDHQGGWVDEATSPTPLPGRSQSRLEAERGWEAFAAKRGTPLQIYRLAGIYGPGRNAVERVRGGNERRIEKPGQMFNRTHVDDIAAIVTAGIQAGKAATGVFNVTDDEPAPPQDVIAYAAELLGLQPPPLIAWDQADLSPMAKSFYAENKRVRNERIKRDLGVALIYPTYREGLRALAAGLKE